VDPDYAHRQSSPDRPCHRTLEPAWQTAGPPLRRFASKVDETGGRATRCRRHGGIDPDLDRWRGPRRPFERSHIRSNACWRSFAASPTMRTAVSRQGERRRRIMPCFHSSPMPIPPVMPVRESATSTLRWSRGSRPSQARKPGGLNRRTSRPSRSIRRKYDHGVGSRPSQSIRTRTLTPRFAASTNDFANRSPISSWR